MAQRIYRLSPHQNGKVLGILWGVVSLVFVVPMAVMLWAMPAQAGADALPFWLVIILPLFYFGMTYVMTAIMCWVYNLLFSGSGGLEFELREPGADATD